MTSPTIVIKVVSAEEADAVPYLYCASTRTSAEDIEGMCAICLNPIFFRPDGPTRKTRICLHCMFDFKVQGHLAFAA